MGDVNRALGGGSELEFEGTTYTISPWTYDVQAQYERYLEKMAFTTLKKSKPYLTDEEWNEQLKLLNQDITIGIYSFGSDKCLKSMSALPHLKHLVWLLLLPNHKEIKKDVADKIVDKALGELMEKMALANQDPTASEKVTSKE